MEFEKGSGSDYNIVYVSCRWHMAVVRHLIKFYYSRYGAMHPPFPAEDSAILQSHCGLP